MKMNKIENFFKRYELTSYLGTTYEDNEKITCYIKKNRIKKIPSGYIIKCKNGEENQKGYVKPICYIINDIEFDAPVIIEGDKNTEIIIKNSSLNSGLSITSKGKCIIDNCRIDAYSEEEKYSASYFSISNTTIHAARSFITISFLADKIDINNFHFLDIISDLKLEAKNELTISNSKVIIGRKIRCKSKVLKMDNKSLLGSSIVLTTEMLEINAEDYNQLNIAAKEIILNGKKVNTENKRVTLKQISNPLKEKRIELTKLLKMIKNEYEKRDLEDIAEYEKQLQKNLSRYKYEVNTKPIGKKTK